MNALILASLLLVGPPQESEIGDIQDVVTRTDSICEQDHGKVFLYVRTTTQASGLDDTRVTAQKIPRWARSLGDVMSQFCAATRVLEHQMPVFDFPTLLKELDADRDVVETALVLVVDIVRGEGEEGDRTKPLSVVLRLRVLKLGLEKGQGTSIRSIETLFSDQAQGLSASGNLKEALVDALRNKIAMNLLVNRRLHKRPWFQKETGAEQAFVGVSLSSR